MQDERDAQADADHPLDADADSARAGAISATVYVKNLAFTTGDEALRRHFDHAVSAAGGVVRSAVVHRSAAGSKGKQQQQQQQQQQPGKGQKLLSAGFGFVECSSEEVAKDVIKRMQVRMCCHPSDLLCMSRQWSDEAPAVS